MIKPMWDAKAVKAYETGQGVKLVDDPFVHYIPVVQDFNDVEKQSNLGKQILREIKHQIDPPNPTRNEVLEEVAKEFEKMPFGDTASSFAIFVRNMKT